MSVVVSNAHNASSGDLLVVRERVLARGGLIDDDEIGVLRAAGPGGLVGAVLEVVACDHLELDDRSRLDLMQLWERQACWVEAKSLAHTAAFEARVLADNPQDRFGTVAAGLAEEVGLMTGCSAMFATVRLDAARLLNPAGLLGRDPRMPGPRLDHPRCRPPAGCHHP